MYRGSSPMTERSYALIPGKRTLRINPDESLSTGDWFNRFATGWFTDGLTNAPELAHAFLASGVDVDLRPITPTPAAVEKVLLGYLDYSLNYERARDRVAARHIEELGGGDLQCALRLVVEDKKLRRLLAVGDA